MLTAMQGRMTTTEAGAATRAVPARHARSVVHPPCQRFPFQRLRGGQGFASAVAGDGIRAQDAAKRSEALAA